MSEIAVFEHEWNPSLAEAALRLLVDDGDMAAFEAVFACAVKAYAPRAWVRAVDIEAVGDDFLMLSGEWFEGQDVSRLLSGATRAWVYVAAAGEGPATAETGTLPRWWLKKLGEEAVRAVESRLRSDLPHGEGERVSAVSPGSLPDFPITERKALFRLFDAAPIGAQLTDECHMTPCASACGILFTSPAHCSCGHCAKGGCQRGCAARDATNAQD